MVDTQRPGMDGPTLARKIRSDSALAKTPLVMMGASKKCEASAAGYSDEFEHRLSKPIRPSLLHATLRALLAPKPQILQKPVLDGASLAPSFAAARTDGVALNATRILVVDDNLVNRQVAQKQLERLGYSADTVDGGNSALAAMSSAPYPVVLLDCEMPDMDGYATAAEIRRREEGQRHTTIIAMTGHVLEGARERCLASGMDEYVAKPVTLVTLGAVLELALHPDERRADGQTPGVTDT
jgi:CheY-like chemotaxis protein